MSLKEGKKEKKKKAPIYGNKTTLIVYLIERALVIGVLVRFIFMRNYEAAFTCLLTLFLMLLPSFFSRTFHVYLPTAFEVIILVFIFAAEILGEIASFYIAFPFWDSVLHCINGFLFAAVGFALVDFFNRNERFSFKLSPAFLAVVAFCFSMTIGVLWEFFEFSGDRIFSFDLQKDYVIHSIGSVSLNPDKKNKAVVINDIVDVIIVQGDGTETALGLGGYLDVGLFDTMKDLFINFIGAVAFSIIGYFYVKHKGKGKIASSLIPQVEMRDEKKDDPPEKEESGQDKT